MFFYDLRLRESAAGRILTLNQKRRCVETETVDSHFCPVLHVGNHRVEYFRVVPVEVRLLGVEGSKIVVFGLRVCNPVLRLYIRECVE